jgi:hypothetical protein
VGFQYMERYLISSSRHNMPYDARWLGSGSRLLHLILARGCWRLRPEPSDFPACLDSRALCLFVSSF